LRRGMSQLGDAGLLRVIAFGLRSWPVLIGGALYVFSLLTWTLCLRQLDLGVAYPVYIGGQFLLVLLGSVFVLKEGIDARRMLGVLCIFAGILLAGV